MDQTMVHKLESEISLLVRELKERDRELNSMVLSHHQQLTCWSRDRECILHIREQLTRAEEGYIAADRDFRHAQESCTAFQKELESVKRKVSNSNSQLEKEREKVSELETELSGVRKDNEKLSSSLKSSEKKIEELSSNEVQIKNVLKQTIQGSEALEQDLQDKLSCLAELRVIRGENEKFREEVNASRERTLSLCQELEFCRRDAERGRGEAREVQAKLQSCVSTLEGKLEVYRTAEERKTQLLASYRSKQERLERELRVAREIVDGSLTQESKSVNDISSSLQTRPDPQRPTRDVPSYPLQPSTWPIDEPFPHTPSPIRSPLRPTSLEIVRAVEDGDITQEVDRISAFFEIKLDNILHSIDTQLSPRQLSAIPEEDFDTFKSMS